MDIKATLGSDLDCLNITKDNHTVKQLYNVVSNCIMKYLMRKWNGCTDKKTSKRCAYYMSAEFLMGRMITSNLLNLGILEEVRACLNERGLDIDEFENVEDCALGNGGLGRLAACFLDSAASLGLNLDGYGIRYRYGLFKQRIEDGFQVETADDWTRFGDPWSVRREEQAVTVSFADMQVLAVPYDMPIIGCGGETINTLRLWQSEYPKPFDFKRFDDGKYFDLAKEKAAAEEISLVLYPNDNDESGKILRLRQEYFFSSAAMQDILRRFRQTGKPLSELSDFIVVQLNDTHPVVAVPELIRLLRGEGMSFDEALTVAKNVFAFTNHTVMSEALETWKVGMMKALIPKIYSEIVCINESLVRDLKAQGVKTGGYEIIENGYVHMARLAVYCGFATNGVAEIHTEILKRDTLRRWYELYPERFYNKTNGITQRRWLALANPELAKFITERVGDGWLMDLNKLEKLADYASDVRSMDEFRCIKHQNKVSLAAYIEQREGVHLDANMIFDVQIKRLHEYKRQLMNAFSILYLYYGIKDKSIENFTPTAFIFGAKAAPGYQRAKGIIKYINEVANLVNNDKDLHDKMRVVYISDYNVSYAEKLVAAGDVSEQISAAGTEASGTGNMKLMMNGAVTLGTYDGANIEIIEAAGEANNYIFGNRVEDIGKIKSTYNPKKLYESDKKLKRVVDSLIDGTFSDGDTGLFRELYESLLNGADWHRADNYYVLADFQAYIDAKLRTNRDYLTSDFAVKCLLNTAHCGRFSSDRTISEYAEQIWKI